MGVRVMTDILTVRSQIEDRHRKTVETHDFTETYWGHRASVSDVVYGGKKLKLNGHGMGILKRDFILLSGDGGRPTRYRITSIKYMVDPRDQWFAEAEFAPR
jgi:hypothetical protein